MTSRSFFILVVFSVMENAYSSGPKPPPPPPPPPPDSHRRNQKDDHRQHNTRSESRYNTEEVGRRRRRSDAYNANDLNASTWKLREDKQGSALVDHDFEQRNYDQRQSLSQSSDASRVPLEQRSYNPIDYNFPSIEISPHANTSTDMNTSMHANVEEDDLPQTGIVDLNMDSKDDPLNSRNKRKYQQQQEIDYGNARKDATVRYGRVRLSLASAMVGASLGLFVGQSLLSQGKSFAIMFGFLFMLMSFLRNDYGEMARTLGLAFIYLWKRTRLVRKKYKTGMHMKAICRMRSRVPFPPIEDGIEENPWKYTPQSDRDPDFEMIKSMLCLLLVGSFCGGNMPLIPTWMGSAGGAATFAVFALGRNPRGDLFRTIGMRLVALIDEAVSVNTELKVARKVTVVVGKVIDKLMILDRKHRIRDKIFNGAAATYDTLSSTISRVQEDIQDRNYDSTNSSSKRPLQRSRESPNGSSRRRKEDENVVEDRRVLKENNERWDRKKLTEEDNVEGQRGAPAKASKKRGFFF